MDGWVGGLLTGWLAVQHTVACLFRRGGREEIPLTYTHVRHRQFRRLGTVRLDWCRELITFRKVHKSLVEDKVALLLEWTSSRIHRKSVA